MHSLNFCLAFSIIICTNLVCVLGHDQSGAVWMPSANQMLGRSGRSVKWIVIHGTAPGGGSWSQNSAVHTSTHYTVGQDGTIFQHVRESNTAWANGRIEHGADYWWRYTGGNPNLQTISIDHVKSSSVHSNGLTPAQKSASFHLIRDIIRRHPTIRKAWANASGGVTGHFSISPITRRSCPGPYPWDDLFSFLNADNTGGDGHGCVGTVTSSTSLRIRAEPNTWSPVLGAINSGHSVQLVGRTRGQFIEGNSAWFNVGRGYISGRFVRLNSRGPSWCAQFYGEAGAPNAVGSSLG